LWWMWNIQSFLSNTSNKADIQSSQISLIRSELWSQSWSILDTSSFEKNWCH
jgi:hypothetical protein